MPRLAGRATVMAVASLPRTSMHALRSGRFPLQFCIAETTTARLHITVVLASTIEYRTAPAAERASMELSEVRCRTSRELNARNRRERTAALADRTTKELKM